MGRQTLQLGKQIFQHEVAVHGMLHVAPGMQRPIEGIKEVLNCRLELEERFDRIIRGMAYPDTGVIYFENGAEFGTLLEGYSYKNTEVFVSNKDGAFEKTENTEKFDLTGRFISNGRFTSNGFLCGVEKIFINSEIFKKNNDNFKKMCDFIPSARFLDPISPQDVSNQ